jgi:DNA replication protein DnaC
VREFWASGEPILVLAGGNGCGKTLAACSAIRENCIDNAKRGYLAAPGDMLPWWVWRGCRVRSADAVATLSAFDAEDEAEHKALLATPLLILDEAGHEPGDGERGIGNLLCHRIGNRDLRTIVTTNLSRENFARRYGNRLMSRLGGPAGITVVHSRDLRAA